MKRVFILSAIAGIVLLTLAGCEGLIDFTTAQEQVGNFLAAASADPQNLSAMQSYFDPDAADYPNMYDPAYWQARFFNPSNGPYTILNPTDGSADPEFPNSVTVTGSVTNSVNPAGYPAVFVLTTDPDDFFAAPLIRKITVTVTDPPEVIEKVIP